ncbi:morn repeat-containing protein [Anaeramoeba flamelloides]|uniref:Morn repeat-containing protein n=1 Tax=Anaeramoeba flamelloides TaxID=1746091 RepID=A0AAV7Z511_9EUKA|nr:morn repeat-containing protein [Anaeramoeba flamelloides]
MTSLENFFGGRVTLQNFLSYKICLAYFEQFLRQKAVEHNLLFLVKVEQYTNILDPVERSILASSIYEQFLVKDLQLPIKKETKKKLKSNYEKRLFSIGLFYEAQRQVQENCEELYLPQFLKSKFVKPLAKDLKLMKKGYTPFGPKTARNGIVEELVSNETEYLSFLRNFKRNFFLPLKNKFVKEHKIITSFDVTILALNWDELITLHQNFLSQVIEFTRTFNYESSIGKLFLSSENNLNKNYSDYFRKIPLCLTVVEKLFQTKNSTNIIKKTFHLTKDQLEKHLQRPFDQIKKYEEIIKNFFENTKEDHSDYPYLISAEQMIKTILLGNKLDKFNKYQFNLEHSQFFRFNPPVYYCEGKTLYFQTEKRYNNKNLLIILFANLLSFCFKDSATSQIYSKIKSSDIRGIYIMEEGRSGSRSGSGSGSGSLSGGGKYPKKDNVLKIISPEIEITIEIENKIKLLHLIGQQLKKLNLNPTNYKTQSHKIEYQFQNKIIYKGFIENGRLSGEGEMIYPNGIVFEGKFDHNKKSGQGLIKYRSGSTIVSKWMNNNTFGFTTINYMDGTTYIGDFLKGMKHNKGQETTLKGDLFRGNYHKNKREGKGFYVYSSGTQFTGEFHNNKKDGYGILEKSNGLIYFGHWKNDKMSGKGKMVYENGDVYIGDWKKDMKHGKGTFTSSNTKYKGAWKNNQKHGIGTQYYGSNKIYIGNFFCGVRWGKGKYICGNYEYDGLWKDDLPNSHGALKCYSKTIDIKQIIQKELLQMQRENNTQNEEDVYDIENNNTLIQKIVGTWKNGSPHGIIKINVINKIRYEGRMEYGKKIGKGTIYYKNGTKITTDWNCDLIDLDSDILIESTNSNQNNHKIEISSNCKTTIQESHNNKFNEKDKFPIPTINENPGLWMNTPSEICFHNFWC